MKINTFHKFVKIFIICLLYLSQNINATITAIYFNGIELKPDISNVEYICPNCLDHFEIKDKKNLVNHIINEYTQNKNLQPAKIKICKKKTQTIYLIQPFQKEIKINIPSIIAIINKKNETKYKSIDLKKISEKIARILAQMMYSIHSKPETIIVSYKKTNNFKNSNIILKYESIEQIQAEILAFLFLNNPIIKHPITLQAIQICTIEELEEIAKMLGMLLE